MLQETKRVWREALRRFPQGNEAAAETRTGVVSQGAYTSFLYIQVVFTALNLQAAGFLR
jgi:hypothetical protein